MEPGGRRLQSDLIFEEGPESGSSSQSIMSKSSKLQRRRRTVRPRFRELATVLDSPHAEHMVQSVLLPLDDASLWLSSRATAPRWILAGASGHCAEVGNRQAKRIQAATAAGFEFRRRRLSPPRTDSSIA